MNILRPVGFVMVGAMAGAVLSSGFHEYARTPVVHAQDQFSTFAGCIIGVPKAWGSFMGGSSYGLAFQDDKGTLRFIEHPLCGSVLSVNSAPTPALDLEIVRK